MSTSSHTPKDAKMMAAILKDCGVYEYEPRVINQMLEFAYRYISDMLDDSKVYSEYAGKKQIDSDDVKLAIQMKVDNSFSNPPPKELLLEIAKEKNSQTLPSLKQQSTLRLPPDRYCLTQSNYRLKAGVQHTVVTASDVKPTANGHFQVPFQVKREVKPSASSLHVTQSSPALFQAPPNAGARPNPIPAAAAAAIAETTPTASAPPAASTSTKPLFRLVSGTAAESTSTASSTTSTSVKRKFDQVADDIF